MAANIINFLKPEELIDYCGLDDNLDMERLKSDIYSFQIEQLYFVIGKDKYNELQSQVLISNVSTNNRTLLDVYIFPYMCWGVLLYSSALFQYKLTNKGIVKKLDSNSLSTSPDEVNDFRAFITSRLDGSKNKLVTYLCENNIGGPCNENPYLGETDTYSIIGII